MKAVLIYPPANARNCEVFPLPSLSTAALAGALLRAGHAAEQADLDHAWHTRLKGSFTAAELRALGDRAAASAYARGAARGRAFDKAARLLAGRVPEGDLYGITLADLNSDPLLLNLAAALAALLRRERGKPVVIGHRSVPEAAYRQILAEYPVFDYAVFAQDGEDALLRLLDRLGGGRAALVGTLRAEGGRVERWRARPQVTPPASPHFQDDVLAAYRLDERRIFSAYGAAGPAAARLLRGGGPSLVVPYSFETTCPGACAFCANDNRVPSNAKPPEAVVGELAALKARGVTGVYFVNSAFNNSYAYAERLCALMIRERLGLQWSDCANMREIDEPLLRAMRAAGAVKLTFGMETASPRLLKYIRKGTTVEKISRYLGVSHRLGIWNHIELIGGLPTETPADAEATCAFVRERADVVDAYSLNPFFLHRSSPFYRRRREFGLRVRRPAGGDYLSADDKVGNVSERFDEAGGRAWAQKDAQIRGATAAVGSAIEAAAGAGRIDFDHIWLLMALYRRFGHARKRTIRELMSALTARFTPFSGGPAVGNLRFSKHEYRRVLAPARPACGGAA